MTPLPGMFATVRNRLGVVVSVSPSESRNGEARTHLVHIDYKDGSLPLDERLVWELEPHATCTHPTNIPDTSNNPPMATEDFDAILRAARWSALMPYIDPDQDGPLERLPVCSPLMGAVKVEDFQLIPLYKALAMPRVAMLIADDVGLGKTIEAGLILSELVNRRRIGRILVLTPASLRDQWKEEMQEKFSLGFEIVDRETTQKLRKEVGIDANPWRVHDRIIASYHYLKQPDILELFMSASRTPEGAARLPWDMVIVDECHNAMPSAFGEDSDLCAAIRHILPLCEHRLFLSATPHNGRTRSFTGLLEMLDPVRFTRSAEMNQAAKNRVEQIMVRRLKRHIDEGVSVKRFCKRLDPKAIDIAMATGEARLFHAFEEFRSSVHRAVAEAGRGRQLAGSFAVEIFGKRLISSPLAFADSWWRSRDAFDAANAAEDVDVEKATKAAQEDTDSDAETEAREAVAARVVGSWLVNLGTSVLPEIQSIDQALDSLGLGKSAAAAITTTIPREDGKLAATIRVIDDLLRPGGAWSDNERIIIFTEFKTTLDYLVARLRAHYKNDDRFLCLFGGMDDNERKAVKDAFNRADASVRILIATDAASEGLNLQQTARYMLHYDCPWNPMRLEQRIGRLDRHGQGRDVQVFHFTSSQSADLRFLAKVIEKVDSVREDLGSCGEVFDKNLRRRLIHGESSETVEKDINQQVEQRRKLGHVDADKASRLPADPLAPLTTALDLSPDAMAETLDTAMAWGGNGRPQLSISTRQAAAPGSWQLVRQDLPGWKDVIDRSLRRTQAASQLGAMRDLAFSASAFMVQVQELKVFKNRPDTVFVHLAHPLMRQGLQRLTRTRYPGRETATRWTVRRAPLPPGCEALVLLSVEELAVNQLRETFHHWIRTVAFPVENGKLGSPLPERPAAEWAATALPATVDDIHTARDLMPDLSRSLRAWLENHRTALNTQLAAQLAADKDAAEKDARHGFQSRAGELSELIQHNTVQRLQAEIDALQTQFLQRELWDRDEQETMRAIADKEAEIRRRTSHLEEMRAALEKERSRVLDRVIPRRYAFDSDSAVFPVTIEIRLPEGGAR